MAFDFPASPSEGQIFSPAGGPSYVFNSPVWRAVGQGQIAVISDTFPANPANGQLFWESDSGILWIWYNDGNSSQWVQVGGAVAAVRAADPYNRVVNGAMQHSQENGSTGSATTALNAGYYAADQWQVRWDVPAGTINGRRWDTGTPSGSTSYVTLSVVTAVTSLAAASYVITTQIIEGLRVADLGYGAAGAKQMVLRFWVNAPAGTYSVAVNNNASDRSYVAQYTVSASATWEMKTIVIPGDVTGTWLKDTGIGLRLNFVWAVGSSYVGVTGWQAGGKFSGPGQATSLVVSTNYTVADVGLYADPLATGVAPAWQTPDYANELAVCKRYWQTAACVFGQPCTSGSSYAAPFSTSVALRAAPSSPVGVNQGAGAFPAAAGTFNIVATGVDSFYENRTANATGAGYYLTKWTLNARM
jgi:hypothetical protein